MRLQPTSRDVGCAFIRLVSPLPGGCGESIGPPQWAAARSLELTREIAFLLQRQRQESHNVAPAGVGAVWHFLKQGKRSSLLVPFTKRWTPE